jgi:hypothetical protein
VRRIRSSRAPEMSLRLATATPKTLRKGELSSTCPCAEGAGSQCKTARVEKQLSRAAFS